MLDDDLFFNKEMEKSVCIDIIAFIVLTTLQALWEGFFLAHVKSEDLVVYEENWHNLT